MNKIMESSTLSKEKVELILLLNRAIEQTKFYSGPSISFENIARRAHSIIKNARIRLDPTIDERQPNNSIQMSSNSSSDKLEQRLVALFAD